MGSPKTPTKVAQARDQGSDTYERVVLIFFFGNHATFSHTRKITKPSSSRQFRHLVMRFYPHDSEKILIFNSVEFDKSRRGRLEGESSFPSLLL